MLLRPLPTFTSLVLLRELVLHIGARVPRVDDAAPDLHEPRTAQHQQSADGAGVRVPASEASVRVSKMSGERRLMGEEQGESECRVRAE